MINKLRIIINADDFGFNSSINKAIVESFQREIINSSTIMANMPGFEEAVELAHKEKISDRLGVHLVLTGGPSLTKEINELDFLFKGNMSMSDRIKKLLLLNKHEKDLVFREYSAQIEKVRAAKISISHLDTHHQIHDIWSVSDIIISLLKKYNIPSMRILNNLGQSAYSYKGAYRGLINRYLRYRKVNFSDYLGDQKDFTSRYSSNPDFISKGKVEIMVHPDYDGNGKLSDRIGKKFYGIDFMPFKVDSFPGHP